ncbi:helix-turn-helix domain-containing protein [Mesorhizobium sp. M0207]|uniref:helix-turn-helix domain-containing protein n=1 Tax=Mesorhizobium sp. M0207 TaxID=2956915 RepID=UPI0033361169
MMPQQCRAARALVGWSQQQLADAASVGVATIRVFEGGGSEPRSATLQVLCLALEAAGVVFLGDGDCVEGGPGVRLKKMLPRATLLPGGEAGIIQNNEM